MHFSLLSRHALAKFTLVRPAANAFSRCQSYSTPTNSFLYIFFVLSTHHMSVSITHSPSPQHDPLCTNPTLHFLQKYTHSTHKLTHSLTNYHLQFTNIYLQFFFTLYSYIFLFLTTHPLFFPLLRLHHIYTTPSTLPAVCIRHTLQTANTLHFLHLLFFLLLSPHKALVCSHLFTCFTHCHPGHMHTHTW